MAHATVFPTNSVRYVATHAVCVQLRVIPPPRMQRKRGWGSGVYARSMSIPVAIPDLEAATAQRGWAYLLTVRDDIRPHVVAVSPVWDAGRMAMHVGRGSAHNVGERPAVTLCYPPVEPDGYSLIVDGAATVDGEAMVGLAPTGAVLHRPALDGFSG